METGHHKVITRLNPTSASVKNRKVPLNTKREKKMDFVKEHCNYLNSVL